MKGMFHGGGNSSGSGFGGGTTGMGGIDKAQGYIYNQLHRQSAMLAYMDIIAILGVFCLCMIPLALSLGRSKPPADGPAMH